MLEPFKFSLLADAGLDNFNPAGYFPYSNITDTQNVETRNFASLGNFASLHDNGQIQSITAIIPKILDAAKELREKLIQYAADTKDHKVSDTFVQLLRIR